MLPSAMTRYRTLDPVLVLPEHVSTPAIDRATYATIQKIAGGYMYATTKVPRGTKSVTIKIKIATSGTLPTVVTSREYFDCPIGAMLRQGCVFADERGAYTYGQVTAHCADTKSLTVTTRQGNVQCAAATVASVEAFIAILLFDSDRPTVDMDHQGLRGVHAAVAARVRGDPLCNIAPTTDLALILENVWPSPTIAVVPWIDMLTGTHQLCGVQHAVNFTRYESTSEIPAGVVIGYSVGDDPTRRSKNRAPPPPVLDLVSDDDDGDLDAGPTRPTSQMATRRVAPSATAPASTSSFLPELSPSHVTYARAACAGNDPRVHDAPASAPAQRLYDIFDRELAQRQLTRAANSQQSEDPVLDHLMTFDAERDVILSKTDFNPDGFMRSMFKSLHDASLHLMTGMEFARHCTVQAKWPFHVCPAIVTGLFHGDFGPGRISINHFHSGHRKDYDAWCRSNHVDFQNYGKSAKLPLPTPFESIQGLRDACRNFGTYAKRLGSPILLAFYDRLSAFEEDLPTDRPVDKREVQVYGQWIDESCAELRAQLGARLLSRSTTPPSIGVINPVTTMLSRDNRRLDRLVAEVLYTQRGSKREGTISKEDPPPKKRAKVDDPSPWNTHVPIVGGKRVCMRNLSVKGCTGGPDGGCTIPALTHQVPTAKLHASVLKRIESAFGGLHHRHAQLQ
jgi:hypothetical protein